MSQSRRETIEGTELPGEHSEPRPDPENRKAIVARAAAAAAGILVLMIVVSPGCRNRMSDRETPLVSFPGPMAGEPVVRMAVRTSAPAVNVAVSGPFKLFDGRTEIVPEKPLRRMARAAASFDGRSIRIGAVPFDGVSRLTVHPETIGTLEVEGQVYPGDLELVGVAGRSTFHAIVRMGLEEYVCGVVAGEVRVDSWHEEALKAQAVASRTYALYCTLTRAGEDWDFGTTGLDSQQYRTGMNHNAPLNKAVNSTSGEVLTWDNMVFKAWFHSSCGGHTVDATHVFTRRPLIPLAGVECPYCLKQADNKYVAWKKTLSFGEIARRLMAAAEKNPEDFGVLKKMASKDGQLRSMEVAEATPDPDRRIVRFLIRGPRSPGSAEFTANDVRLAIGPSELPSTKCRMTASGSQNNPASQRYTFEGSGWGHGVGLCQWGSQQQAQEGRSYQAIVAHYFPSSRLLTLPYGRGSN